MTTMELSIISVIKKLFWRVMVYILAFIVVGILLNWGFMLAFGYKIRSFDRWGSGDYFIALLITIALVIIFPTVYFFLFKGGYFESIVGLVWHEYRDDLVEGIINHSSHMIITHYSDVKGDAQVLHTKMNVRFDDAPFWSKLLVQYVQKKLPLLDKIVDVVQDLDQSAFESEETLKVAMKQGLEPYLHRTDVATQGGVYWIIKVIGVNVVLLVLLYLVLYYF